MSVATFEAVVLNGQIKLPDNIHLPEQTRVYVVIPSMAQPGAVRLMSPRLVRPEQALELQKTVISDANI
jgi:hypothetical protein